MSEAIAAPREFIIFEHPARDIFQAMFQRLDAVSAPIIGPAEMRFLVIPLRDQAGEISGGFWGCTTFSWLHVQLMLVPESLRAQGLGGALLRAAEREAQARACLGAYVDSFSFQAVEFYQKHGYRKFGELIDYPPGYSQVYLSKKFAR